MSTAFINSAAAVAGVATHLGYFNRSEHHLYPYKYLQGFLILFSAVVSAFVYANNEPIPHASVKACSLAGFYLGGLYTSLIIYRGFLHPLRKFPGPSGAKFLNLWYSTQLGNADAYKQITQLHQKYGEFLRIGPADLSIIHPEAVSTIYGPKSTCRKGIFYDCTYPNTSVHTERHEPTHELRRRTWSPAFSDKAIRGYEERTKVYRDVLIKKIAGFKGQPVNVSKWFNFFSFDVMGDLAFAKSFDMLEDSKEHWAIKLLNEGMGVVTLSPPTWLFRLALPLPYLSRHYWRFMNYCGQKLDERINTKVTTPDIMSALLEPLKGKKPTPMERATLQGDSHLIIVAGSDTTAATLTFTFYELARNPEDMAKVRDEVTPLVSPDGEVVYQELHKLNHLNGVINEAMRLHPPVPSTVQRLTPPEGITIGGTYIPGGMHVWSPQYAVGRNENVYTDANSFIPERWYSRPKMVKEKTAFAPFSAGRHGCIGKPLALLNIRATIARLLTSFDVSFAPGEDGTNLLEKTRDHFTLTLGDLELTFTERAS